MPDTVKQGPEAEKKEELHRAGLKATGPRIGVLQVLEAASADNRHLSADEVYAELQAQGNDVGLATVYRVLTQFEAAGLIARHNFEGGHAVFEMTSEEHHDHIICLETGKVIEFVDDAIERLQEEVAESYGYELVDHSLVLYVRPKRKKTAPKKAPAGNTKNAKKKA